MIIIVTISLIISVILLVIEIVFIIWGIKFFQTAIDWMNKNWKLNNAASNNTENRQLNVSQFKSVHGKQNFACFHCGKNISVNDCEFSKSLGNNRFVVICPTCDNEMTIRLEDKDQLSKIKFENKIMKGDK